MAADRSILEGLPLKNLGIDYVPEYKPMLERMDLETINGVPAKSFWVAQRKEQNRFHYTGLAENLKSSRGLLFTPQQEQDRFFSIVDPFPPQARLNAIVSKLAELANDGPEVTRGAQFTVELTPFGDAPTECIVDAWSVHQLWPLSGIKTLQKVNLIGTSVTDFRPLATLPIRELDVEVVLYNSEADHVFSEIESLQTINGQPKDQYLAERKAMRDEIDAFQKTAQSLTPRDLFPWIIPRLKKLNPDYGDVRMVNQGIQPGDGRISLDNGLLNIWSGGGLRDLSPLRVLPFDRLHLSCNNNVGGRNIYDLASLRGLPLQSIALGGNPLADLRPLKGMPLKELNLILAPVSDLSPLVDLPLESINLARTYVTDFSPLKEIKTLKTINGKPASDILEPPTEQQDPDRNGD